MTTVFISHATADDDIVTRLHDELEAATGHQMWVDHKDLVSPDSNYRASIQKALQTCDAGLLVLSRNSTQRPEIVSEWTYLLNTGHPLYIAKIDDVPLIDIDYRLHIVQWVDLSTNWETGVATLAAFMLGKPAPSDAPLVHVRRVSGIIDRRLTAIPMSGRDDDLAKVKSSLMRGPTSIVGVGGLGKSRLAAEIVMTLEDIRGAIWHYARDVSRADDVLELLREHFGLQVTATRRETLERIKTNKLLIVIDNAESIPDERKADYITLIDELHEVGARVLLTGRAEWDIVMGQVCHPVTLPIEAAAQVVRDMAQAFGVPAATLDELNNRAEEFAKAARQHPRLIEWAVKQVIRFPVENVLRDLRELKSQKAQDALDEMIHKTVRQMEAAGNGAEAKAALEKLVVFRGGFTYEAAQAVLDANDDQLMNCLDTLQTWQFVTFDGRRYEVDPMVLASLEPDEIVRRFHYAYYIVLAGNHDEAQDYAGFDVESANLEAAFEWVIQTNPKLALWLANGIGNFFANRGRFHQELSWYKRIIARLETHDDNFLRSSAQNGLGFAYNNLAEIEEREKNLKLAIAAFEAALAYWTAENAPVDYANTHNNLGEAYRNLAQIEEQERNLKRALTAHKIALMHLTKESNPLHYAMTQNNLGNVYGDLSKIEERESNLKQAITAYEAALVYRTTDRAPLARAQTHYNLGVTYYQLSNIEEPELNVKRAVAAYEAALENWTATTAPLDYADTQWNLGVAHEYLGDIESAIAYWCEAAKYYRSMGIIDKARLMLEGVASLGGECE